MNWSMAAWAAIALAVAAPAGAFEYSQAPILQSINASTGLNSEIADDIPSVHAGEVITEVTLYVAEWLAAWVAPQALVIRFYDGACAPPLSHTQEFAVDWSTLSPVFYGVVAAGGVAYEVTVQLPQPVTISAATSMGVSVDNPWGPAPPYCGFLTGGIDQAAGCGELYWDSGTVPRNQERVPIAPEPGPPESARAAPCGGIRAGARLASCHSAPSRSVASWL